MLPYTHNMENNGKKLSHPVQIIDYEICLKK